MNAMINDNNQATLEYLSVSKVWDDDNFRPATKAEFLKNCDLDDLFGSEGDAVSTDDFIICTDGIIKGVELL